MADDLNPAELGGYILLPARGLRAVRPIEQQFLTRFGGVRSTGPQMLLDTASFFSPLAATVGSMREAVDQAVPGVIRVIDSVHEDGPKLVEMSHGAAAALAQTDLGVRALPLRYYVPAQANDRAPKAPAAGAAGQPPLKLTVTVGQTAAPVADVAVIAFTSVANDEGTSGTTDASGEVFLQLGASPAALDSLYVAAPASGAWGFYRTALTVKDGDQIQLTAIVAPFNDSLRGVYAPSSLQDGQGVKVAVIDTGVGPHPDLIVGDGANTAPGEVRTLYADNGAGHGTHVAGIIAGRGSGAGPMGIAPGAALWSGRVYPAGSDPASNYSIMKAMILATEAGCDLLNLSLETDSPDPVLEDALADAVQQGAVAFVAGGNSGQQGLAFPASCADAVGITAFGALNTYPADTPHAAEVGAPQAGSDFFASFSNWGAGTRFIAPGVGVISTAVGAGYGVRSGTSMACAAATGMAARLLAKDAQLLAATHDAARSAGIQNMLQAQAHSLSFPITYQGAGRL